MTTPSVPASPDERAGLDTIGTGRADDPWSATLDHVPLLGAAIEVARSIDRSVAQLLDTLLHLMDDEVAERATGVPLEQWLGLAARRTASDRRMLLTACDVLRRLPSLRIAFCDEGSVSWAQTRAVVLAVHRLPRALDDLIDGELARTIDVCRDDDPDVLTSAISRAARSWDPIETSEAQRVADREEFVALQPRLDGSGGRLFGDLGPLSFATVDAALASGGTGTRPGSASATDVDPPDDDDAAVPVDGRSGVQEGDGGGDAAATEGAGRGGRLQPAQRLRPGQRRARRLVELCDASLVGGARSTDDAGRVGGADDAGRGGGAGAGSRPQLLVRVELATLLDRDAMPAELLTHLTGGKLWIDASTARRLVQERGADLRAVVLDDCGRVVGVGRRNRIAPGWLVDATLALHDTCTHPGCVRPARRCQTDHARPWHPTDRDRPAGRTDIDELGPLCVRHNGTKEASGWRATGDADGSRRWEHPRSGLRTTTRPGTWRAAIERYASGASAPPTGPGGGAAASDPPPGVARERAGPYRLARSVGHILERAGPPRVAPWVDRIRAHVGPTWVTPSLGGIRVRAGPSRMAPGWTPFGSLRGRTR